MAMTIIKPPGSSSSSTVHAGFFDVTLPQGQSEVFGTVTGLPSAPARLAGYQIYERDAGVIQSGITYELQAYSMTGDGFNWRLSVDNDEYWPGPGSVILRVDYMWSET